MTECKQIISRTFLLAVLFSLMTACAGEPDNKAKKGKGKRNKKPTPVALTTAEIGTASSLYVTTATLEPSSDASINARTSGVIREILQEEGDDVRAGDILLRLEDDDQELRLKQARQHYGSTEREYKRLNKMRKAGAVSSNEWEAANDAYLRAKTDVELAELALSYTRVVAPFDGRIVWREVDLGAYVSPGNLLFRIMAIKPLLVRLHVPANRIGLVAKGQKVELNAESARQLLYGDVILVSPIVDPNTGTIKVTVELQNYPPGVRPGDFTEVRLATEKRENAFLLPSVAIMDERGKRFVFIERDGRAVRLNVEAGYVVGDKTEVISGLSLEDRVVVKGQRKLKDGKRIVEIKSVAETVPGTNTKKTKKRQGKGKKSKNKPESAA